MGVPPDSGTLISQKYGLPIKPVITPGKIVRETMSEAYVESGIMINSPGFDGWPMKKHDGHC